MVSQTTRKLIQHVYLGLARSALMSPGLLSLCLPLQILVAVGAVQATPRVDAPIAIGQLASEFTLFDLTGQTRTFKVDQGRPAILNFWATWCAPCREEMPILQQAHDTYQRAGLIVLAISQDPMDRAAAARTYWTQSKWTFSSLLDPDGVVARQYQVMLLPSTVFINAHGLVTAIHRGPLNATQLKQYLANIIAPQS
jgi:thiol-disulfide isomerase/thioredoxin